MTPEDRLAAKGIVLPPAPRPVAAYVPFVCTGDLVFVSGQLPMRDGKVAVTGKVGGELTAEQGAEAARLAAVNGLAQLAAVAGGLNGIERIIRLGVFVNSAPGFTGQPGVANGASELMADVFGEAGHHARAAVGVNELPLDAAVEVEIIARLKAAS